MCGRYMMTSPRDAMSAVFGIDWPESFARRYNIAPSQLVPVIRRSGAGTGGGVPGRELALVRWGLIPGWAKDAAIGHRLINARGDTVAVKPAFRDGFAKRRCLVIADGFFEWRRTGGRKHPYLIRLASRRPFGFAGLWSLWHDPAGRPVESCTIITTEPNDLCRTLHHRMPVILRPEDFDRWLDPGRGGADLLRPFEAAAMEAVPVSSRVNDPRNDDPQVVAPVERQPNLL